MKAMLFATVAPIALATVSLGVATSAGATVLGSFTATSDIDVDSATGSGPFTFTAAPGLAKSIDFDLDIEHFFISWASETTVTVTAPDSTTFGFTGAELGFPDLSGPFNISTSLEISPFVSADGTWSVFFDDTFDDTGVDYRVFAGSTVSVNSADLNAVPLPGGLALAASAAAALGGLRAARRRNQG